MVIAILLSMLAACSGQPDKTTNNSNLATKNQIDTVSAGSSGGKFSLLQNTVEMNISSGSLAKQTDIAVKSINNPIKDPSVNLLSCYEFGPDGQVFSRPIDVIIHYNVNDLPKGMAESDLKVYLLKGNTWEPINGSFANQSLHYVVAKVSHFSKMGCGGSGAPSGNQASNSNGSGDEGKDGSAQYWFKADLFYFDHKTLRLQEKDDDDMYAVGVSAYWKPVSYVQYYQIKFLFNGNPPKPYGWSCDFREQSKSSCPKTTSFFKEGYIFHLGGDPNLEGYIGLFDTEGVATAGKYDSETGSMKRIEYGRVRPAGTHGFGFLGVNSTVEDREELSELEKESLVSSMRTFVKSYVNGWEIWVRGVTERGN